MGAVGAKPARPDLFPLPRGEDIPLRLFAIPAVGVVEWNAILGDDVILVICAE